MSFINDLSINEKMAYRDLACKRLLCNSQMMARIIKYCVVEAKDLSLDEIEACICDAVVFDKETTDKTIHGKDTVITVDDKEFVKVDILVKIKLKKSEEKEIHIYINLEAQNDIHPGYSLISRGIVYCAMLIARQYKIEFGPKNYDKVKKVYSIWIMPRAPKYMDGLIRMYTLSERILEGNKNLKNNKEKYDKINVIQIFTSLIENENDLISKTKRSSLLNTFKILFSEKIDIKTRIEKLKEFGFKSDPDLEERVDDMCNLSAAFAEDITKEVKEEDKKSFAEKLINLLNRGKITLADAAETLEISEEEFKAYMA